MARQSLLSKGLLIIEASQSHSDTSHSVGDLPDNTQYSEEADIHALDGIRTRNPSQGAAAYPCLRPVFLNLCETAAW